MDKQVRVKLGPFGFKNRKTSYSLTYSQLRVLLEHIVWTGKIAGTLAD
uniref:Uncharacterized protein n=1 Tax=Anguilla anguilla TaxID=7936 RepID=A0A0E9UG34_ANGAN